MTERDVPRWHGKEAWRKRAKLQLKMHPLCKMCAEQGQIVAAEVADHIIPHRGDSTLFWFGELQSLCTTHHNKSKQQIETNGYSTEIGADGFPIDPNHPFNKASQAR